jgi:hypothetical protein
MKRAIFPDEKLLQPIPTTNGVHANISGNTNSTTLIWPTQNKKPVESQTNQNLNTTTKNEVTSEAHYLFYIICFLATLGIIFALIYITKNRVQRRDH